MKYCQHNQQQGMTLIEVLIALAVLAISLTALVRATTMDIRDTNYLRDKSIALWVATNSMSTIQLDIIKVQKAPATIDRQTAMLGQDWYWTVNLTKSEDPSVDKIEIKVRKNRDKRPLIILNGFKQAATNE